MSIANHLRTGKSTVSIVVVQVCEVVSTVIYLWVVGISKVAEIVAGFEEMRFLNYSGLSMAHTSQYFVHQKGQVSM